MRETFTAITELVTALLRGPQPAQPDLDRSLAAATAAHAAARRALAIAVAEERREMQRCETMVVQAADLEDRAVQAIRAARDDLAVAASETIAAFRTEIEASQKASSHFAAEVALARNEVNAQRRRLLDLDRGRRLAAVGQALSSVMPGSAADPLTDAEDALARVNVANANARAVRAEMAPPAQRLTALLASEGFGAPLAIRPEDVLARLRSKAAGPVLIETSGSREHSNR
jgi:phage shock protein A